MVQLKILSGRSEEASLVVRRFPCVIGRSPSADVRLEESGVWDRHLELALNDAGKFVLRTFPNALATVNGASCSETPLKNGDLIEMGILKIRFWLCETRQQSLRLREIVTWLSLGILSAGQIGLIYWLLR